MLSIGLTISTKNTYEPHLKVLQVNLNKGLRNLNSELQIEIKKEIERCNNMSTVDKLLNRLNLHNRSNPNLPVKSPYDRSEFGDLFTTKESLQAIKRN